ncbi:NAD(P)/FAD-dependent oxidoreductase [Lacibacterium aquatile]|uniref:NAD(P)/FAD-dependent oxidoreductase n=1 Tax=Lacibacterium aquatile TaxID=1168082 RepID=A0ABW5DWM8_9PROT
MQVAVIGGGIIGVAAAHALLDAGHSVTVVDREGFAAGTSQGNAGMIAHTDILPLASAKAWANLPRWLSDPLGPLAIRPSYIPQIVPWMARFALASFPARVEASTRALIALQGKALSAWEGRLGALRLEEKHLRKKGYLSVWSDAGSFANYPKLAARQRSAGIKVEILDRTGVKELEPALSRNIVGGAYFPTGVSISDPRALTKELGAVLLERGAKLMKLSVQAISSGQDAVRIHGADGSAFEVDRIVVATGAWSKSLAGSMGDKVPLDTERGYNITLPTGRLGLSRSVIFEGHGFVTSALDIGDRVGGAVEFAGLEAEPNYARIDAILGRLRQFLPDLDISGGTRWMGHRPSLPDSLPVISSATRDRRVVYAFGHGHYGLTQAAVTGLCVEALVSGSKAPIDLTPFSVERF